MEALMAFDDAILNRAKKLARRPYQQFDDREKQFLHQLADNEVMIVENSIRHRLIHLGY